MKEDVGMKKALRKIISIMMAVIMVVMVGAILVSAEGITADAWMSAISDETMITAINIPGTHDSAARYVTTAAVAQTQSLTIVEQLKIGVRYFDLRLNHENDNFNLVHDTENCKISASSASIDLTGENVVNFFKSFLAKHPSETILCQLKEERSSTGNSFYSDFYSMYISGNEDLWFTENRIPSIGEVRGKIVVLRAKGVDKDKFDDTNCGIDFSAYPYVPTLTVDDWRTVPVRKVSGEQYTYLHIQDSFKIEDDDKWASISGSLQSDLSADGFNICCTNCSNSKLPSSNAGVINAKLKAYTFESEKLYGIIAMDYVNTELAAKIISTNNIVVIAQPVEATTKRSFSDIINEFFAKIIEFFMSLFSIGGTK